MCEGTECAAPRFSLFLDLLHSLSHRERAGVRGYTLRGAYVNDTCKRMNEGTPETPRPPPLRGVDLSRGERWGSLLLRVV